MLIAHLVTNMAPLFSDVRTYWSPEAVERVVGRKPTGRAANGFIHLINSGATALDATGAAKDADGNGCMKEWWNMTDADIKGCLEQTDWCRANYEYFRGGGFSSHFKTGAEMPITMMRLNIVDGIGPMLQIAEGYTVVLDEEMHRTLDLRTDRTWPTTWFAPRLSRRGCVQGCVQRDGKLGSQPWRFCLRSCRSRYDHAGKYAAYPGCNAQCSGR